LGLNTEDSESVQMREWIVTNGIGGYASLTHHHTTTRKFHGLLVASLQPPTNRWVFVSNILDFLVINNKTYCLQNHRPVFSFHYLPSLTYIVDDVTVKKTFCMERGKNTSIVQYDIKSKHPCLLRHQPLVTTRHFYDCLSPDSFTFQQEAAHDQVTIKTSRSPHLLKIKVENSSYVPHESWEQVRYDTDRERNDSWLDSVVRLGSFERQVPGDAIYYACMTVEPVVPISPAAVYYQELLRLDELLVQAAMPKTLDSLMLAADRFIVKKGDGVSVVAGYHWFSDWGRDTLIALPGLTLVTKRYHFAREILLGLAEYCRNGLIPNVFMDRDSAPAYNTVDASLWFVDRVFQYMKYTNDQELLFLIWPTLDSIIQHYIQGTDFGIHMDSDGLICHGPGLTWMDVKLGDYYPTPRDQKAVEIQALWYNALRIMGLLAPLVNRRDWFSQYASKVQSSFRQHYDKLYDVIDRKDTSLRPNMVFLASLDFPLADEKLQEEIVDEIQDHLLSLFGLQTLTSTDPRFKGSLLGPYNKDVAYHNGIVWPWLLGPFLTAFVKVHKNDREMRQLAQESFLNPMFEIFGPEWDGSVPELFDAEPPFAPQGCISQAWSVGEILRAIIEDIEGRRPPFEKLLHEIRV